MSPLVSLMEDQLMALQQLEVPAAMLNAASSKDHVKFVQVLVLVLMFNLRSSYFALHYV